MPACRGQVSDPWFPPNLLFNCQPLPDPSDPWKHRVGCKHGCRVCPDQFGGESEFDDALLISAIGVSPDGRRHLTPHPVLESRDATGLNNFVDSPSTISAIPIPPTWVGLLAPCRDDKQRIELPDIPICRCRGPECDPIIGCPWCQGSRETCNIYFGVQWPHQFNDTLFCTGDGFPAAAGALNIGQRAVIDDGNRLGEGPIRVVLQSERPELDQAAFVRTGLSACASNLGVRCWGTVAHTAGCTTHRCENSMDPDRPCPNCTHYFGCTDRSWILFQTLQVVNFSARFRADAMYVDRPVVRVKNAALDWLTRDMQGTPGLTKFQYLNSFRVGSNRDADFNGALDYFRRQYAERPVIERPAVAPLPGTYLRNSRRRITGVEYVLRGGEFALSFVPHFVRPSRFSASRVSSILPVIKAHLSLFMGVRVVEQEFEWNNRTVRICNGENGFPTVENDFLMYVDEHGDQLHWPPRRIEVEFDLGPFSEPAWHDLAHGNVDPCNALYNAMDQYLVRSLFVPVFKTNQHHASSPEVWKGGMNIAWGFDPATFGQPND